VIGWEPRLSVDVVNFALPLASNVPVPIVVVPSLKVTVPVGGLPPPVTVAVKMIGWPKTEGLSDETSAVVVGAGEGEGGGVGCGVGVGGGGGLGVGLLGVGVGVSSGVGLGVGSGSGDGEGVAGDGAGVDLSSNGSTDSASGNEFRGDTTSRPRRGLR
jgi:hypothetical protein